MSEFYGAVVLGPLESSEHYMIIINDEGEEERIPEERFWEYSIDAMRYKAPQEQGEQ